MEPVKDEDIADIARRLEREEFGGCDHHFLKPTETPKDPQ